MNNSISFNKKDRQFLVISAFLYVLYIIPLVLVDLPYVDDMRRMLTGLGWLQDGRIVAHYAYYSLSFGRKSLDLFPLPIIIGTFCILFAGWLIYKRFFYEIAASWASLLIFPLIANPFYLQNLSYRFDSFTMGLSILLAVYSFYLLSSNGKYLFLKSVSLLILCLLTYQPSITLFIGLSLLFFTKKIIMNEKAKEQLIFLFFAVLVTICSYFIYNIISKPYISTTAAVGNSLKLISFNQSGFYNFIDNLKNSIDFIKLFVSNIFLIAIFIPPFIISSIYIYISLIKSSLTFKKIYDSIAIFICISLPFLLFIITLLPILPLQTPLIAARVLIGFFSVLFYSFYGTYFAFRNLKIRYFILLPIVYLLTMSYAYSNASKHQFNFDNQIVNYLAEDLKSLDKINTVHNLIFLETPEPYDPKTLAIVNKFPIFKKIIQQYFWGVEDMVEDTFLPSHLLKHHPMLNSITSVYKATNKTNPPGIKKIISDAKDKSPDKENPIYILKIIDNAVILEYKELK